MLEKEDRSLASAFGDGRIQFPFNPFEAVFINAVCFANIVGIKRYKLKSADFAPTVSGRFTNFFPKGARVARIFAAFRAENAPRFNGKSGV